MTSSSLEAPRRVLVIDDSELELSLMRTRLRMENITLIERLSGQLGFEVAQTELMDLALIDLEMPDWDGFETIKQFKDSPKTKTVPVIFLSERDDPRLKAKALDLGACDYVTKPFDPVELRARVRVALRTKYLHDLLEHRANLDGLTGLGNRHAMRERLGAEWANCSRRAVPLAVVIADLDHFKRINDQHGHSAGDEILRGVAQTLNASVRQTDFVARYGGEEFVVIAPDCDLMGAHGLAERFRDELAASPFRFGGQKIPVTSSLGITSMLITSSDRPETIIDQADQALYQAKSTGRNRVRAWDQSRPTHRVDNLESRLASY